jgi:hypothetical protein
MPWLYIGLFGLAVIVLGVLVWALRASAKEKERARQLREEMARTGEVQKAVDDARQHPVTDDELFGDRPKPPTG